MFLNTKSRTSVVSVEESSVARKRVWTYERPPRGTSAATRPLHAHRREAMEQIERSAAAKRRGGAQQQAAVKVEQAGGDQRAAGQDPIEDPEVSESSESTFRSEHKGQQEAKSD